MKTINHHSIFFNLLTFPRIPPLSTPIRLCHSVWSGSLRLFTKQRLVHCCSLSLPWWAVCFFSNEYIKPACIWGASLYSHGSPQASDIWATLAEIEVHDQLKIFLPGCLFTHFFCLLTGLPIVGSQNGSVHRVHFTNNEIDHSRLVGGGLISKGAYLKGLSWATARWVDLHACLPESSKFIERPSLGSVMYTIQVVSTTHYSPKFVSLGSV